MEPNDEIRGSGRRDDRPDGPERPKMNGETGNSDGPKLDLHRGNTGRDESHVNASVTDARSYSHDQSHRESHVRDSHDSRTISVAKDDHSSYHSATGSHNRTILNRGLPLVALVAIVAIVVIFLQLNSAKNSPGNPDPASAAEPSRDAGQTIESNAFAPTALPVLEYEFLLYGRRKGETSLFTVEPNTRLHAGDGIKLRVKANRDCYLYVVNRDAEGKCYPLFPHDEIVAVRNPIPRDREVYLPAGEDEFYVLDDTGAGGAEEIWYALGRDPLPDLQGYVAQLTRQSSPGDSGTNWIKTRGLSKVARMEPAAFPDPKTRQQLLSDRFSTADAEIRSVVSFQHQ